ncbi:hypothetical protein GF386_00410 [Candidatus Pacearchaeota archaeon]|nr:hypothetical protein [Candidatus Pacearchaeota archaeon]
MKIRFLNFIEISIIIVVILFFNIDLVLGVKPMGANYTHINTSTAPEETPQSIAAQAGNVTEINIKGFTVTQSWQGYFGNVSGTIYLADSGDNSMYNWSLASPEGEVYASTNDSIKWSSIHCFNFTATGDYSDDSSNTGNMSLYGTNLSQLESSFNIDSDDVDGVNETFNLIGTDTHDGFFTANLEFEEGECYNTRIFSDAGKGETNKFEEVLLYDSQTRSVVFASILEQDVFGFDSRSHDFEMLVLEDGHGTDVSTTPYYFYVELQ